MKTKLIKDATDIKSYEEAIDFLGYENEAFMLGVFRNAKALIAIEKLITIAEAWNKTDNFVPDFDDLDQDKWFPWFQKRGTAGFTLANANKANEKINRKLKQRFSIYYSLKN